MASKFYVVWVGRETGVFTSWPYAKKLVDKFPAAKYKSFTTRSEAEAAFTAGWKSPAKSKTVAVNNPAELAVVSSKEYDVTIYCDGGCDPNPGESASGVSVYCDGKLIELWYGLYDPRGTNNTAELNALYQAMHIAKNNSENGKRVQILCDSQYSINCITLWAFSWKEKGWKRKTAGDIKNLEIIQQSHKLFELISNDVDISHVRAHTGIEGNELADRMSIYGIAQKNPDFCRYSEAMDIATILNFKAG